MPARKHNPRRPWTPEVVRKRMKIALIARRVRDHALGKVEMTATQLKAAEICLRKGMPDLKSIEHKGDINLFHQMTDAELDRRIAELSAQAGVAIPSSGETTTH